MTNVTFKSGIYTTFFSIQICFSLNGRRALGLKWSAFEDCSFQLTSSMSSKRIAVLLQVTGRYQRGIMFQNHMIRIGMMRQLLPIKVPTSIRGGCLHSTRRTFTNHHFLVLWPFEATFSLLPTSLDLFHQIGEGISKIEKKNVNETF